MRADAETRSCTDTSAERLFTEVVFFGTWQFS